MDNVISVKQIEATKAFQTLDKAIQPLYLKRPQRETITNALVVWRNTKYINENIGDKSLRILRELIELESKQDK